MKLFLFLLALSTSLCSAQNYYQNGRYSFFYGPNGYTGTGIQIGHQSYYWDNCGGYGSEIQSGSNRFYRYYPNFDSDNLDEEEGD